MAVDASLDHEGQPPDVGARTALEQHICGRAQAAPEQARRRVQSALCAGQLHFSRLQQRRSLRCLPVLLLFVVDTRALCLSAFRRKEQGESTLPGSLSCLILIVTRYRMMLALTCSPANGCRSALYLSIISLQVVLSPPTFDLSVKTWENAYHSCILTCPGTLIRWC